MSVDACASDEATDLGTPVILGASVIGDAHVRAGLPCQDAFRTIVADGIVVVVVADGLGSAPRADAVTAAATEAAAARAFELASDGDPADAAAAADGAIAAAREALEALAASEDAPLAEFACTLIVAVATERMAIAHVGDGAAVGLRGEEPYVISPPEDTEYLNEVLPLTADDWADHVRTVCCLDGIDAIAVFTDGCQHAAVRREDGILRAHAGFFGPLFRFVRSGVDAEEGELAIAALLAGSKMAEHSDDDKTLVLAALR